MVEHRTVMVGMPSSTGYMSQPYHCTHCPIYQHEQANNAVALMTTTNMNPNPNQHASTQLCVKCLNETLMRNPNMSHSINQIPVMTSTNNANLSLMQNQMNLAAAAAAANNSAQYTSRQPVDNMNGHNMTMIGSMNNPNFNRLTIGSNLNGIGLSGTVGSDRFDELRKTNKIIYDSHDAVSNANAFNELPNFEAFSDLEGNVELYFKIKPKTILIDLPCEYCEKYTTGTVSFG